MPKNIIIFGATGNAGGQVLEQALADDRFAKVTVVGRKASGIENNKLNEIVHGNFLDLSGIEDALKDQDICFYCLGVSQLQVPDEAEYTKITHDYTISAAEALLKHNPDITFCFLSGMGADPTMKSKTLFARVKGRTENSLYYMQFKSLYIFRPGYIHPVDMHRKKYGMEKVMAFFYPLMSVIMPGSVTTSEKLARAMINVGLNGHDNKLLDNKAINGVGGNL